MSYSNNTYVGPFLVVKSFGKVEDRDTAKVCSKNRDHKKHPHYAADQYCSICGSPLMTSTLAIVEKSFYTFCKENNINDEGFYVPEFVGENTTDKFYIINNNEDDFKGELEEGVYSFRSQYIKSECQLSKSWKSLIDSLIKNNIDFEYHFGVVNYQS